MIYRGFKIERVIFHRNESTAPASDDQAGPEDGPNQHVEYVVYECMAGVHWQEVGTTNAVDMAMELIDRIVVTREKLSRVVGIAI